MVATELQHAGRIIKIILIVMTYDRFFIHSTKSLSTKCLYLQSKKIQDNCISQLERIRESYTNQTKNLSEFRDYSAQQLTTMRDQYQDQVNISRSDNDNTNLTYAYFSTYITSNELTT